MLPSVMCPDPAHASSCDEAARAAEIRHGLPDGLLSAIGRTESGGVGGWSWSVNPNDGTPGQKFRSPEEAEAYAGSLLASGRRMIDVGCFQIDLSYHPDAFARWQDAFDSDTNAEASARILMQLHQRTSDWNTVVALYHSADPARGQSYLRTVLAKWNGAPSGMGDAVRPILASLQADLTVVLASASAADIAVWTPDGRQSRQAGRPDRHAARLPIVVTP